LASYKPFFNLPFTIYQLQLAGYKAIGPEKSTGKFENYGFSLAIYESDFRFAT